MTVAPLPWEPILSPRPQHDDAYTYWEREVTRQGAQSNRYVPVLLRLYKSAWAPGKLRALIDNDRVSIGALEDSLLDALEDLPAPLTNPERLIYIQCRETDLSDVLNECDSYTRLIAVGPPTALRPRPAPPAGTPAPPAAAPGTLTRKIIGIIDDGIGYLNRRFRTAEGMTRFEGLWIQSLRGAQPEADAGAIFASRAEIDAELLELAEGTATEPDLYSRRARKLFPLGQHIPTRRRISHGTHVLDVAGGAEPGKLDDLRLIAVQLPPHAIKDTSGRRMESYVHQGLRWIAQSAIDATLAENVARAAEGKPTYGKIELCINLSIGAYAGAKDGSDLLETMMGEEKAAFATRAARALGGAEVSSDMTIYKAFGNAHRMRQSALLDSDAIGPVRWRIPPDSGRASFVEIRGKALALTLTPPRGETGPTLRLNVGEAQLLRSPRGPIAGLFREPDGADGRQVYVLAVGATRPPDGEIKPVAPAGAWTLAFDGSADTIDLQVQRDDVPFGYPNQQPQSRLEPVDAYEFDPETHAWGLAPAPISILGTCSADMANCLSVSAYGDRDQQPSPYSAAGRDKGPDISAAADLSRNNPGLTATGTFSGSLARLSGTSVACALAVRARMTKKETHVPKPANSNLRLSDQRVDRDIFDKPF